MRKPADMVGMGMRGYDVIEPRNARVAQMRHYLLAVARFARVDEDGMVTGLYQYGVALAYIDEMDEDFALRGCERIPAGEETVPAEMVQYRKRDEDDHHHKKGSVGRARGFAYGGRTGWRTCGCALSRCGHVITSLLL